MQIFVKTLTGKKITLLVEASDNVTDVKAKLEEKEGIPICYQTLFHGNKILEGDKSLSFYRMSNEATLFMFLHWKYQGALWQDLYERKKRLMDKNIKEMQDESSKLKKIKEMQDESNKLKKIKEVHHESSELKKIKEVHDESSELKKIKEVHDKSYKLKKIKEVQDKSSKLKQLQTEFYNKIKEVQDESSKLKKIKKVQDESFKLKKIKEMPITNQGSAGFCVMHAMGTSIARAGLKRGFDFLPKSATDVLVNVTSIPDVTKGRIVYKAGKVTAFDFDTAKIGKRLLLQDMTTHEWRYVDIEVRKCKKSDYNNSDEFVLGCNVEGGKVANHCVFVENLKDNNWECLNSWGPTHNPNPVIHVDQLGNILCKLLITFHSSQSQRKLVAKNTQGNAQDCAVM